MTEFKKEILYTSLIGALVATICFWWTSVVDKQVNEFAEKVRNEKKQEDQIIWKKAKLGPPISFRETLPSGYKTKP